MAMLDEEPTPHQTPTLTELEAARADAAVDQWRTVEWLMSSEEAPDFEVAQLTRRQDAYLQIVQHATSLSAWLSWVEETTQGRNQGIPMPPISEQSEFDQMLAQAATFGSDEVQEGVDTLWSSLRAVFALVRTPGPVAMASFPSMTGTPLLGALAAIDEAETRVTELMRTINRELRAPG
jgi:hypothetical protein